MKTVHISGKRKHAIARATVREGTGIVRINRTNLETYKPEILRMKIMEPIIIAGDAAKKVDLDINVFGGGYASQAEAARLALARGLVEYTGSKSLKREFLDYDRQLLVADVRRNEPHKPNDSKPRAARQKSYR